MRVGFLILEIGQVDCKVFYPFLVLNFIEIPFFLVSLP